MRRLATLLGLVLVTSHCLTTPITAQKAAKGDKATIEGVWVGTLKQGKVSQEVRMEFKAGKFTMKPLDKKDDEGAEKGPYKISPDKSPAHIDLGDKAVPGIYELKGDELKMCFPTMGGGARPSAFKATEKTALITLKRQKP